MQPTIKHTRKPYTVHDDDDLAALARAYKYLSRQNPLWLVNMPGVDNRAVRAEYRARFNPALALVKRHQQQRQLAA